MKKLLALLLVLVMALSLLLRNSPLRLPSPVEVDTLRCRLPDRVPDRHR